MRRAVGRAAELVVEAFAPLIRREVSEAEALLLPAFSAALLEGDAILAAIAVLNLIGLYVVEEHSAKLREIAPQVGLLADAEAELTPPARAALAALHKALESESGSLGTLVLAVAAALDLEPEPRSIDAS